MSESPWPILILPVVMVLGCGAAMIDAGARNREADRWKREAIARGVAEYVIQPDGGTRFKWKDSD